jgi:hypothetical protein
MSRSEGEAQGRRVDDRRILVYLFAAFAATGLLTAVWPHQTGLAVAVLLAVLALSPMPRPVVSFFLLFLVFQDPLQVLAGATTTAAKWVKHADEFMLLLVGVTCLLGDRGVWRGLLSGSMPWAIAGCYVGMVGSSLVEGTEFVPAMVDLALFSKPFLLFVVGMSLTPSPEQVDRSVHWLLLGLVAVVAFGVVFLLAPGLQSDYLGDLESPEERMGFLPTQGFFIGPGTYSWFSAATFCLCYAAYIAYNRTTYLLYSAMAATFVVLSWRRKSIIAVLAVLLVAVVAKTKPGSRLRLLALAAVTVVLGVTLLAPYVTGLWAQTLKEYGNPNPYANARIALYYGSLLIARDHFPLGTGLASFGSHASRMFYSSVYHQYGLSAVYGLSASSPFYITDTFWPMVLGQGGVISFVAYASFLMLLLRAAWRRGQRLALVPSEVFLSLAATFLIIGSLSESTASHVYGSSLQAALVLIPAGIVWRLETSPATV